MSDTDDLIRRAEQRLSFADHDPDSVLVRDLVAAVKRVEALAGDLEAHRHVDPTDPDADVIREAEDSIAHWIRQALAVTE